MEKSASFPAYNLGTTLSAQCYLGIEPLLQRAASTGDAELLLTLLKVRNNIQYTCNFMSSITFFDSFEPINLLLSRRLTNRLKVVLCDGARN